MLLDSDSSTLGRRGGGGEEERGEGGTKYLLLECVALLLGDFKAVLQLVKLQSQLLYQLHLNLKFLLL